MARAPAGGVGGPLIRVPKLHQFRIEQEGPRVRLLLDGRLVFDADWQGAERVGWEILQKSRLAQKASPAKIVPSPLAPIRRT